MSYTNHIPNTAKVFLKENDELLDYVPLAHLQDGLDRYHTWINAQSGETLDLFDGNLDSQLDGVVRHVGVAIFIDMEDGEEKAALFERLLNEQVDRDSGFELDDIKSDAEEWLRKNSTLTPNQEKQREAIGAIQRAAESLLRDFDNRKLDEISKDVAELKTLLKKL